MPPALQVHAERCAHQLIARASCQRCVDTCPRAAWQWEDGALALDATRCDSCGLCVAACPQEALALPAVQPLSASDPNGHPLKLIACERAFAPHPADGGAAAGDGQPPSASLGPAQGVVPCLHALAEGWFLTALAHPPANAAWAYAQGDCAHCPRMAPSAGACLRHVPPPAVAAPHPAASPLTAAPPTYSDTHTGPARWQVLAQRMAAAGRAAPAMQAINASTYKALLAQTLLKKEQETQQTQAAAPDSRRRFWQRITPPARPEPPQSKTPESPTPPPPAADATAPLAPLTSARCAAVQHWQALAPTVLTTATSLSTPSPTPQTPSSSTATGAATPAFQWPPLWSVALDAARCNWCMACVRLCEAQALRVTADATGTRELFTVDAMRCTGCGLCTEVCDVQALTTPQPLAALPKNQQAPTPSRTAIPATPQPAPAQPAVHFPLLRQTCGRCGVVYRQIARPAAGAPANPTANPTVNASAGAAASTAAHRPQPCATPQPPPATPPSAPPLCPTCLRGRPAQRNRVVQQT